MTSIKLDGALPKDGGHAPLADQMWGDLGGSYLIVAEVHVSERTEVEDLAEKEPSAKLRAVQIEVATPDSEQGLALLDKLRAMRNRRENRGTLLENVDPDTGEIAPPAARKRGAR